MSESPQTHNTPNLGNPASRNTLDVIVREFDRSVDPTTSRYDMRSLSPEELLIQQEEGEQPESTEIDDSLAVKTSKITGEEITTDKRNNFISTDIGLIREDLHAVYKRIQLAIDMNSDFLDQLSNKARRKITEKVISLLSQAFEVKNISIEAFESLCSQEVISRIVKNVLDHVREQRKKTTKLFEKN